MQFGILICILLTLQLVVATIKPGEYEIRTLTGEPNYKSVNLSWDLEIKHSNNSGESSEVPKSFTIHYCELQHFGPHRCRSKVIEENSIEQNEDTIRHYSETIDNLRMATKYSFHIKPQVKKKLQKISGRSDSMDNEVEPVLSVGGQTIVIPTKGFTAEATRCLPHVSEIEVETGPYFGGKIAVDGGNCGIQGNPKDPKDKYVMRIDHAKCGSIVKPETNTVETFITVQENLGIFTHSTRRFVVVCTFQSGIQTVRASFTVPGKGGVAPIENDHTDNERNGRERQFRMVDRSALILKEPSAQLDAKTEVDTRNSVATLENVIIENPEKEIIHKISSDSLVTEPQFLEALRRERYSMLLDESHVINEIKEPTDSTGSSYSGLVVAASLSLIMIGFFIFIIYREFKRVTASNILSKSQIIRNP